MLALVAAVAMGPFFQGGTVPSQLQNVSKIVMLGDSITAAGSSPRGYLTLVGESINKAGATNVEIVNKGIGGQKAPDMLARFQSDVIDLNPQLVTISVGVNDVWHNFRNPSFTARVSEGNSGRGIPLPKYLQDVGSMIEAAQKAKIRVILLSPTLVYEDLDCAENKRLSEYVKAEHGLADKYHVTFVNLNQPFRDTVAAYQKKAGMRSLLLTLDGVHMNDAGNALMADTLLRALGVPVQDNLSPH